MTQEEVSAAREQFGALWTVYSDAEQAVIAAIDVLRDDGYTWREVASMAGGSLTGEGMRYWRQRHIAIEPQHEVVG